MRRIHTFLIAIAVLVMATPTIGQLDITFGTNGVATANTGVNDIPLASFVLPDGKILVISQGDWLNSGGGPFKLSFIRFNSDGTPDAGYGTNGIRQVDVPYTQPTIGYISGAARQSDGKIVLVGKDGILTGIVARYSEDGTLDSSFAGGGIHRPDVHSVNRELATAVLIQPDGKILVAGAASDVFYLLRYLPNGTLDNTFGTGGSGSILHPSIDLSLPRSAEFFALQSTGKIVVGNSYAEGPDIVRFNSDGTLDGTFTPINLLGDPFGSNFFAASIQADDKILAGTGVNYNDALLRQNRDSLIARYNADGTPDGGFGVGGNMTFDLTNYQSETPIGFRQMADGQILVAVNVNVGPNRSIYRGNWLGMVKLSSTGTLNGEYLVARSHTDRESFTSILPDGKILTTFKTTIGQQSDILVVRTVGVPLATYKFRAVPFDFGPLGKSVPSVYRSSTGAWYSWQNLGGPLFGLAGDILVPSDYIGNFQSELAMYRPSDGTWYIAKSHTNPAQNYFAIRWGLSGDIPQPNDYDGDGKSDIAVFRPSDGNWYIRNSSDESYRIQHWGTNGDRPVSGDFDGDGRYDLAVYRPSQGFWYIYRSSDGGYDIVHFGLADDIPVQEDYDGDGKTDIAVYRPSNGVWYRLNSSDGSYLDYPWGIPGDIPVPGDYDGDLKTNIAVFRPSAGRWYVVNPDMVSMHDYLFGMATDTPLAGKF